MRSWCQSSASAGPAATPPITPASARAARAWRRRKAVGLRVVVIWLSNPWGPDIGPLEDDKQAYLFPSPLQKFQVKGLQTAVGSALTGIDRAALPRQNRASRITPEGGAPLC